LGKNQGRKSPKAEAFEDLRSNCEQFSVFEHFSCRKFGSTQTSLVLLPKGTAYISNFKTNVLSKVVYISSSFSITYILILRAFARPGYIQNT
jgi:hypothetical protein